MKRAVVFGGVVLFAAAGLVHGGDGELHGVIDFTYQSRYVWRGFDIFGEKSAIQPAVDLDLYGTGFGVRTTAHRANSGKFENAERWDYMLYYYNGLFEGTRYATEYKVHWVYYSFADMSRKHFDLQEVYTFFSWPKLLGVEGLVPRYCLAKPWPANSGSMAGSKAAAGGTASGFVHIFMLDYAFPVGSAISGRPDQVLRLHSEAVYNDGVGPGGQNIDQDWSHAVFGVATDFDLGGNFVLTPAVYHQVTMDKSVNPDKDETWVDLSVQYRF